MLRAEDLFIDTWGEKPAAGQGTTQGNQGQSQSQQKPAPREVPIGIDEDMGVP